MKIRFRLLRWLLVAASVVVLLFLLQVSVLAFPEPWFAYQHQVGSLTFYSDVEFDSELQGVATDVERRIRAVELFEPTAAQHIFVCHSQKLYGLFARLTLVPGHVPGFNLSVFDNSFVSVTHLDNRRAQNNAFPPFTVISGDLAHAITHELIHDYAVMQIGFWESQRLSAWKSEGYAEYAASQEARKAGQVGSIGERMDQFELRFFDQQATNYYRWSLIVEYLAESRGLNFVDIMHDSVTYESASDHFNAWLDSERAANGDL